jgi:hypothetical protein
MKTDFMFLTETIGLIKKLIFQVSRHLSLTPQYLALAEPAYGCHEVGLHF